MGYKATNVVLSSSCAPTSALQRSVYILKCRLSLCNASSQLKSLDSEMMRLTTRIVPALEEVREASTVSTEKATASLDGKVDAITVSSAIKV